MAGFARLAEVMQGYYDEMVGLGRLMIGGFALALGFEQGFFEPWLGSR